MSIVTRRRKCAHLVLRGLEKMGVEDNGYLPTATDAMKQVSTDVRTTGGRMTTNSEKVMAIKPVDIKQRRAYIAWTARSSTHHPCGRD
jgi:hypothetical protein